jgi:lipopolysaccharide heptosyltransferase III
LNRILVIRGGAIGDFILTLPALKVLRDAHPAAHIEVLGYKHIALLAKNRFYADQIHSIAEGADLPHELANYFASFDLIVSYLYDPNLIFEANLRRSGSKKVICGPATIENSVHATRQLVRPIEELGLVVSDFASKVFPSEADRHRAAEFLAGLTMPIVALHPGSGSEKKNWQLQNWITLGNYVQENFAASLVIVSGEAEQSQTKKLQTIFDNSRTRFANLLPLPHLAAVLEKTIFVGHDSGISHLASATGADSILLFGPTDPAVWAPLNKNVCVIRAPNGDLSRLDGETVRQRLDQELMRIGIST